MTLRATKKQLVGGMVFVSFAAMLMGCQFPGNTDGSSVADEGGAMTPETQMYDEVCLLPNATLKSAPLLDAVASGIQASGVKYRLLKAGDGVRVCPFVVTYDVIVKDKHVDAIVFQTFENGTPKLEAKGAANADGNLTVQMVANYALSLMKHLIGQKSDTKAAE